MVLAFAKTTYNVNKTSCSYVDDNISTVNNHLRAGYSAQEGERLKERLRTLKKQRSDCNKKKYSTSS